MESAFTPTWRQSLRHGIAVGVLTGVVIVLVALVVEPGAGPLLMSIAGGSLGAGAAAAVLLGRRGTRIEAGGIRTAEGHQPWSRVVDLRAERRGTRTVVSVYLDSGVSVQLAAPYSGDGPLIADPQFELKVSALSHLWRSHRIGGVPC